MKTLSNTMQTLQHKLQRDPSVKLWNRACEIHLLSSTLEASKHKKDNFLPHEFYEVSDDEETVLSFWRKYFKLRNKAREKNIDITTVWKWCDDLLESKGLRSDLSYSLVMRDRKFFIRIADEYHYYEGFGMPDPVDAVITLLSGLLTGRTPEWATP